MPDTAPTASPGASGAGAHTAADDGHHLARGAAANTLVLFASNFRALFVLLIARVLGEAALGRFGMAFATTELLSKAGMLGFDNSIIPFVAARAGAGDRDGARRVLRQALWVAGVVSTMVVLAAGPVLVWLATRRGLDAFSGGAVIMLVALPGIAVARISTGASRAVLSMRNEFYSRGITETWVTIGTFVVAIAIGIRSSAPALAVAAGSTAAAAVAMALASRALNARIGAVRLKPDTTEDLPVRLKPDTTEDLLVRLKPDMTQDLAGAGVVSGFSRTSPARGDTIADMVRFSWPIAASSLLTVLVMRVDVLLLGTYVNRAPGVSVESFGVFCVCAELAGGMRKVRQVFDPIFAPIVATRALSADRAALRDTVAGPGRWVLAAQLPLVGALTLSGGALLSLYGAGFREGATWLALLALAHAANTFAGLVETLLMIERPALNLVNAAATVAVQVAAGVILIPRHGVTGAALAMCLGFALQGVMRFVEVRHVFGWSWPWRTLGRPLVAFTLAFAPAAALRLVDAGWTELASGGIFLGGYVLAWIWLGPDPADRDVWRRLVRRRA